MADQSSFQLFPIQTQSRPLTDLNGRPLQNPGINAGTVGQIGQNVSASDRILLHWLDNDLFLAWRTEARQQLNQAIQNRDPISMQKAAKAWAKANNALNIPWVIDPRQRFLHQQFIAGVPNPRDPLNAEFSKGYRYNDTLWLAPDPGRCIVAPGGGTSASGQTYGGCDSDNSNGAQAFLGGTPVFSGMIPAQARSAFNRFVDNASLVPIQFLPRIQLVVRVPDDQSALHSQYWAINDPHVPLPFDIALLSADTVYNDALWKTEPKNYYKHSDGSDASDDKDGWDTWAYDANTFFQGGVPQQIRPSYAAYAVYLSALISQLEGRTAAQIIQDARAYAIYRNMRSIGASGGTLQSLAGGQVQDINAITSPGGAFANTMRAIGGVVAVAATAVGAAFGGVGAGVGALIGGAVVAMTSIFASLAPPDLKTVSIDDMERPKPWLERSWLSGDPSDETKPPTLNLDAPPGFVRVRHIFFGAGIMVKNALDRARQMQSGQPTIPPVALWVLGGLAFGGAITYIASRMTRGSSKISGSSKNRSGSRRSRRSR